MSDAIDEIDTILDEDKAITIPLENIVVNQEQEGSRASAGAIGDEKIFHFPDFTEIGYGELVRVELRLIQTADGEGYSYLTFTQQMRCRKSDKVKGPDLRFNASILDSYGSNVRELYCGTWDRRCGNHLVELRENFFWVKGSINPVENANKIKITVNYFQRVHNCTS